MPRSGILRLGYHGIYLSYRVFLDQCQIIYRALSLRSGHSRSVSSELELMFPGCWYDSHVEEHEDRGIGLSGAALRRNNHPTSMYRPFERMFFNEIFLSEHRECSPTESRLWKRLGRLRARRTHLHGWLGKNKIYYHFGPFLYFSVGLVRKRVF